MAERWEKLWFAAEATAFGLAIAPFFALPLDLTLRAFGAIGRVVLPLTPAARRIRDNLAMIRPEAGPAEVRAISAEVGDNFGRVLAEYIRMPDVADRADRRRAEGLAHLHAALDRGRGAVVVSAHYGSWEAIRLAAADAGRPMALIYRAFNNPWFDRMSIWRIRRAGEPVLHKGGGGMRDMLRHVKAGGAILVLIDQRSGGAPLIPFLGEPAETATAVAALARKLDAPLLTARGRRAADGVSFDVTFDPPVAPDAPVRMMREVNERIGAWIEADPGQWFWLHRRWKTRGRPAG